MIRHLFLRGGGGGGGQPAAHAGTHEDGGADEINVSGLSGLLADPQTPAAHTHVIANVTSLQTVLDGKQALSEKDAASGYAGLSAGSKLAGSQQTYGSATNTACEGNDARLSDARVPLTHNIVTAHNGFPGGTSTFLRADGTFASPGGGAGADPPEGSYAPGGVTIATGKFRLAAGEVQLIGTQELVIQGTGRLSLGN